MPPGRFVARSGSNLGAPHFKDGPDQTSLGHSVKISRCKRKSSEISRGDRLSRREASSSGRFGRGRQRGRICVHGKEVIRLELG
jgi:hypothetical protein